MTAIGRSIKRGSLSRRGGMFRPTTRIPLMSSHQSYLCRRTLMQRECPMRSHSCRIGDVRWSHRKQFRHLDTFTIHLLVPTTMAPSYQPQPPPFPSNQHETPIRLLSARLCSELSIDGVSDSGYNMIVCKDSGVTPSNQILTHRNNMFEHSSHTSWTMNNGFDVDEATTCTSYTNQIGNTDTAIAKRQEKSAFDAGTVASASNTRTVMVPPLAPARSKMVSASKEWLPRSTRKRQRSQLLWLKKLAPLSHRRFDSEWRHQSQSKPAPVAAVNKKGAKLNQRSQYCNTQETQVNGNRGVSNSILRFFSSSSNHRRGDGHRRSNRNSHDHISVGAFSI